MPTGTVETSLIPEDARDHHFGAVVAHPGRKLSHSYRLVNTSRHDVRLLDVVNGRPCCGEVAVTKTTLHPGDHTDVEVTIAVGGKFDAVVHETLLRTDDPTDREVVLRTSALAVPPVRIEEESTTAATVLSHEPPQRVVLAVSAYGSASDPAVDLTTAEPRSTLKVEWVGPAAEGPGEEGLRCTTRKLALWLDPGGALGQRRDEVVLQTGKQIHHRYMVNWQVIAPITTAPAVIVLKPGDRDQRVLLRSSDRTAFRVVRVDSPATGLTGRVESPSSAATHTIVIAGLPSARQRRGLVTVVTDHPAQSRVELPYLLLDP